MTDKKKQDNNRIYGVIRDAVDLKEYAENQCGISFRKSGNSYRAESPFNGAGDAFTIKFETPQLWLDYSVTGKFTGDVIELCALLNHNGDKLAALLELCEYLPAEKREKYAREITEYARDRQAEQERVQRMHDILISGNYATTKNWLPYLNARGIDNEQIERLKLGFDSNDSGWLSIPRFNYDGIEVLGHNRRDMSDADNKARNENKSRYAYAFCDSFVRKVPAGLQTLSRESKYLALTEGDFDYMNFEREGFAVLSKLSGKDWQIVFSHAEKFEQVVLAYDSDEQGRKYTFEAAQILLEHRIPFCVIELPDGLKDINDYYKAHIETHDTCLQELIDNAVDGLVFIGKSFMPECGIENLTRKEQKALQEKLKGFLIQAVRCGCDKADIESLCERLSECYSAKWLDEVLKLAEKGETESQIVEALCKKHELLYNLKTGFCKYDSSKGIWLMLDDKFVGALVREYLGYSASAKKIYFITEHLKAAVTSNEPIEKFNRLPLFGFKNGTLHAIRSQAKGGDCFKPASDTDYVTHRVSYDYDENAECPTWLSCIDTIFASNEKRIRCFQEFCGYCLMNHCRYQKALILRDTSKHGSNGKSTILEVLRAVFGEEYCTSLEPVDFENEHSIIQLNGKKVNICTDIRADSKCGDSNLKKAITGDTLRGRFLHRDFIEFKPNAKIIFAVNDFLTANISGSLRRRLLLVDCPIRFVDEPQEGNCYEVKADNSMQRKLMKELAGIFNWCKIGYLRLIHNGGKFTRTDEQAELENTYIAKNDSVSEFVAEFAVEIDESDGHTLLYVRSEVYKRYLDFCEREDIQEPVNVKLFRGLFVAALNARKIKVKEFKDARGIRCYSI